MKDVPIEKIAELLNYDPDTGLFVRKRYIVGGDSAVKQRLDHDGYLRINVAKGTFKAHRLAWALHYGRWPAGDVDHINCNRADNRIANLRECNRSQNCHNSSLRRNNKSGVKGVSWSGRRKKWHVQVAVNRKIHNGGMYADIAEAEAVAIALRARLHGEFSNHG